MVRRQFNIRSTRRRGIALHLGRRQKWKCILCGQSMLLKDATFEHIVPVTKGGRDTLDNLALSHLECNQNRGDMDFDTYRRSIGQ